MYIALYGESSQSYRASPAIWDHTVLPATRHRWTRLALTPARQAGTSFRFTYHRGMEGWVYRGGWLYSEIVYLTADNTNWANRIITSLTDTNALTTTGRIDQHGINKKRTKRQKCTETRAAACGFQCRLFHLCRSEVWTYFKVWLTLSAVEITAQPF